MNNKILVTGGCGFLGSHLCDALIQSGNDVVCLDNLHTGSPDNISHLMPNPRFSFLEHDICEPISLDVDEVYNLACPASPVQYQRDPVRTLKTCVQGAINVLDLARASGCKVLQTSTSEIYGDPKQHPQAEDYWGNVNPVGIRSCYDEGKRCAETLFFDYHRQYGVRIKVARLFNTYGPRMAENDGRVISNFIVQALSGQAISMYGNGQQTRSFCYVDDMIRALVQLMASNDDLIGPINLGNPQENSILELADLIVSKTSARSSFVFQDRPSDDPLRRCPDISLAKSKLGWEPSVSLADGLQRTIDFFSHRAARARS